MAETPPLEVQRLRQAAGAVCALLRGFAHEERLLLLCALCSEELSVSELAQHLALQQPNLSQQLGVLRREGLVTARREGRRVYYRVANSEVLAVLQLLYTLYCDSDTPPEKDADVRGFNQPKKGVSDGD